MTTPTPTPNPKSVEEILRRLRAGLNVEIEQDIAETKTALRQLLLAGVPEKKVSGDNMGLIGYNQAIDQMIAYIKKITE